MSDPVSHRAGAFAVVIADDDPRVREALTDLCNDHPCLTVVGTADNGRAAASLCQQLQPELAVVDVMMPVGGVEAVLAILAVAPTTTVAAYTARGDRRTRERILEAGAADVFTKGADLDLAGALHQLASNSRRERAR
jgi:DNA-binding NarL/FixJ family response regulator